MPKPAVPVSVADNRLAFIDLYDHIWDAVNTLNAVHISWDTEESI